MKLQFKVQQYQTAAVEAVVDCFRAVHRQPFADNITYKIHPGQRRTSGLPLSPELVVSPAAGLNLDIEMETGTGKTYVYIKTIMELHRRYGWSKYIVVVPSVAIREGVKKTFDITAEHFQEAYGTKPRVFVYDSARLHE